MDRDRFQRVAELFEGARGMARSEREPYVCERAGDDAELRDEVLALLRHYHEEGTTDSLDNVATPGFTLSALRHSPNTDGDEKSADRIGSMPERIGRYRIISKIAEGGMGVVYLAEQDQPRREVALKLIKPGMDSAAVIARFEQERQALAVIDHPNVAKVLDAGTTERSLPYFVMEYVRGVPITDFCDHHCLSINDRLKLFIRVCDAVQHAHTKGVIHRDLKPSNILVEREDSEPIPKVIDFGVAKALNQRLTERTIFTERGQLIGTPEYMSPEQAEMSHLDIDTRADVYSLGIVLYELLTGVLPFDSGSFRSASFAEIQRTIRETDPPKLSSRAGDNEEVARRRRIDANSLQRRVSGDLDWIVMKCLEKDRERRYDTANALAMDVQRHIEHEPILARPPSVFYTARKFARRNRALVGGTGLAAAFMVLAVTGTSIGLIRTRAAEAEARRSAEELQQVVEFQAAQLSGIDVPLMGARMHDDLLVRTRDTLAQRGVDAQEIDAQLNALESTIMGVNFTDAALKVLEQNILNRTMNAIGEQFSDQPLVEARLLQTVANAFRDLGILEQAHEPQERALMIRRELLGEDHPDTLFSIMQLGFLLRQQERLDEAEKVLLGVLEQCRRILGNDHETTLYAISYVGNLLQAQGRFDEAEAHLREVFELAQRAPGIGIEHPMTLTAVHNVGAIMRSTGRYAEAEPYFAEALELSQHIHGTDHPSTLVIMHSMGSLLEAQGRSEEAASHFRAVLDGRRRALGSDHPLTLDALNSVGYALESQGRLAEAAPFYEEALAGLQRAPGIGEHHPRTLIVMNNLGMLLRELGRLDEAEPYLLAALDGFSNLRGDDHPSTLTLMNNVGLLLTDQGRLDEAHPYYLAALDGRRRASGIGEDHPSTLSVLNNIGSLLKRKGDLAGARSYLQESLERRRRVLGDDDPRTLLAINHMGGLMRELGELEEADRLGAEAVWRADAALPADHWRRGMYHMEHGRTLCERAQFDEAEERLLTAIDILMPAFGETHEHPTAAIRSLIDLYDAWHQAVPDAGHDETATQWRAKLPSEFDEALSIANEAARSTDDD